MLATERLLAFGHFLRDHDIPVDTSALLTAQRIAGIGYLTDRKQLRSGLRSCFCKSREHWQRFDALFDDFWQPDRQPDEPVADPDTPASTSGSESGIQSLLGFGGTSSQDMSTDMTGAGDYKALSLADFRFMFDPLQQQLVKALIDRLASRARRVWLRREKTANKGQRIDFSASMRQSMRTSANVLHLRYRQRQRRLPRFVLLLDVSQSMDVYAKLFLRFTRQLMSVFEQSYAFAFNVELIPLGQGHRQLTENDFEYTLNELSSTWLGGTKIAESLKMFNAVHLHQVVNHKTTVLVFSDGYDTAPVEQLLPEVAAIERCARRLIWVNPLLGRFEPGEQDPKMDPLQPHINAYLSAHNIESLLALERELLR